MRTIFRLQAKKGQKLFLRMGELMDECGEFTQKNIQLTMEKNREPKTRVVMENGLVELLAENLCLLRKSKYIAKYIV